MMATIIYLCLVVGLIISLIKFGWPEGRKTKAIREAFENACVEITEKQPTEIDLTQKVKWKFEKTSDNRYIAWFYNPCAGTYWIMPDSRAYLQGEWSFQNMAGYGAYDLSKIEIRHDQIDWFANQYKTLSDIQFYFDTLVKKWHAYEEEQKKIEQFLT